MFDVRDLFQWEKFITPSIIRIFFWLAVILAALAGISRAAAGIALMPVDPIAGGIMALASIAGAMLGILGARLVAELILVLFRMNEHLGALRSRAEM